MREGGFLARLFSKNEERPSSVADETGVLSSRDSADRVLRTVGGNDVRASAVPGHIPEGTIPVAEDMIEGEEERRQAA